MQLCISKYGSHVFVWSGQYEETLGFSIDASRQIFSFWSNSFRKQDFLKYHLIRNKNCPWRPCFFSYLDKIRKLGKEPSINAFCKVWFHFAQLFQRRNVKVYRWQMDPKWWQKLILPLAGELTNFFLQFKQDFDQLLC